MNNKTNADGKPIRDHWEQSSTYSTAFEAGKLARQSGKAATECPYPRGRGSGAHRNAWLDGHAIG